jgi:HTH-type transcriptional regulator / antitoxin HigA
MRKTVSRHRAVTDDYLKLVLQFPLRPIRTASQYDDSRRIHLELMSRADTDLNEEELDYVQVLGHLIREYDEAHSTLRRKKSSPIQRLKFLMEENGMNTIDLGKLVGGSGQASLILNGKRQLSKTNILTLARRFKVNPSLFLQAGT